MDLPYRVEYAKTGRGSYSHMLLTVIQYKSLKNVIFTAGCKKCKSKIDQGVLRIAAMVQSFHHDGKGNKTFFYSLIDHSINQPNH